MVRLVQRCTVLACGMAYSEVYFPHSYCYGEGEEEWPVFVMHLRITEMVVSYSLKDEELKNLDLSFLT